MSSFKIIFQLLLLLPLTSMVPIGTDSPPTLHSTLPQILVKVEEFEDYVQISKNFVRFTKPPPPIDPREAGKYSVNVNAPDMRNMTCEEKITLAVFTVCEGKCDTGRQTVIANDICDDISVSDDQIKGVCCPEKLTDKATKS